MVAKKLYVCKECKLAYASRDWAEKCEEWCSKHRSCNPEIISHSVENER